MLGKGENPASASFFTPLVVNQHTKTPKWKISPPTQKLSAPYRSFNHAIKASDDKQAYVTCTSEWALDSLSSRLFVEHALFFFFFLFFSPLHIFFNHLVTNIAKYELCTSFAIDDYFATLSAENFHTCFWGVINDSATRLQVAKFGS